MAKQEFYPVFTQQDPLVTKAGFGIVLNGYNLTQGSSEATQFYNSDGSEAFRLTGIDTHKIKGTNVVTSFCFDTSRGSEINADPAYFVWPELLTIKFEYQGTTYTFDKALWDSLTANTVVAYGDYIVAKARTATSHDVAVFPNAWEDKIDVGLPVPIIGTQIAPPVPIRYTNYIEYLDPLPAGITAGEGWKLWAASHHSNGSSTPLEGYWGSRISEVFGVDYTNNRLWVGYPTIAGISGTINIFQEDIIEQAYLLEGVKVTYLWDGDGGAGPSLAFSNRSVTLTNGSGRLVDFTGSNVSKTYTRGYWVAEVDPSRRVDITEAVVTAGEISISGLETPLSTTGLDGYLMLFDETNNTVAAAYNAQIQA